jgi:hypothetical protein
MGCETGGGGGFSSEVISSLSFMNEALRRFAR